MTIKSVLKKIVILVLLFLISYRAFSSLLRPGYFPMHDDMQAMRLLQIDKCIKDGQIPCRWVPDMGYGYGYPQFNYYSPTPYYIMEGFHLVGLGYLDSVKAGFVLSVILSAIGMFLLGNSLWGVNGGMLSALVYVYAPYRAVDMYVRGGVGEIWAMAFVPFVFWAIYLVMLGKRKSIVWLALSTSLLFTSHNITSMIIFPIFIAWILFLMYINAKYSSSSLKKNAFYAGLGIFWGILISAFFIFPAWIEKGYVHIETLISGYFNYLAHFVSIGQLLFSSYWGYGTSQAGPYDELSFAVGILQWVLPFLILLCTIILKRKREFLMVLFFTLLGWVSLFLTHQKSVWIWNHLAILSYLQFPWRFLLPAMFSFSLAIGGVSTLVKNNRNFYLFIFLPIFFLSMIFYGRFFRPGTWLNLTDKEKFSGDLWVREETVSIFDYLPIYAKHPPNHEAPNEPIIFAGNANIVNGKKGTDWQVWNMDILGEEAKVNLPIYDFPIWKVWVDSIEVNVTHDNELGLVTITLSEGSHEVLARLTNTPVRCASNVITITALVAIPIFLTKEKRKK